MASSAFSVSVLRPKQPGRPLYWLPSGGVGGVRAPHQPGGMLPFGPDDLQEQIYYWDTGLVDPWQGLKGSTLSADVRKALMDGFAASVPVTQRSPESLLAVVAAVDARLVSQRQEIIWQDTPQEVPQTDVVNLRVSGMEIVLQHLRWVGLVFRDLPGASVVLR